jgi:hypothetical protein
MADGPDGRMRECICREIGKTGQVRKAPCAGNREAAARVAARQAQGKDLKNEQGFP